MYLFYFCFLKVFDLFFQKYRQQVVLLSFWGSVLNIVTLKIALVFGNKKPDYNYWTLSSSIGINCSKSHYNYISLFWVIIKQYIPILNGWPEFRRQNFEETKYWRDFSLIDLDLNRFPLFIPQLPFLMF